MKDQIGFELLMEGMRDIHGRLQIYDPLSPISSDEWDCVSSSDIPKYMSY